MARARLVPTSIVDRNGKTTTVHKKMSRASTIPSIPSIATRDLRGKRAATAQQLAIRVDDLLGLSADGAPTDQKKLLNMLGKTYSMRFTDELETLFAEDTDESRGVAKQIIKGQSEYKIGETRYFYHEMEDRGYSTVLSLVESLRCYSGNTKISDLRDMSAAKTQQNIALLKVTDALHEQDKLVKSRKPKGMYVTGKSWTPDTSAPLSFVTTDINQNPVMAIRNKDMFELVMERASEADKIANIINTYGLVTAQPIRGILDGVTPSLAEGML